VAEILLIEDEENLRFSIRRSLERSEHSVREFGCVEEGLAAFESAEPDLVLSDLNLPGSRTGLDLVRAIRQGGHDMPIVMMTAYGSVDSAVEAMKAGADEYLQKPLSLDELAVVIDRCLRQRLERNRLALYRRLEASRDHEREVLGASVAWLECLRLAERVAMLPVGSGQDLSAILLIGETGTGKGMLARHVHRTGAAAEDPFVQVNCSALPATLIESELFGHQRGAFTDARENRRGLFELADGGTIFLDEIGDLPLELQSKLLLVVEQGTYRRLGSTQERTVNTRIIAATNHDLARAVDEGRFRRDLYYRLNALTIPIPPLRERAGDAVVVAEHVLHRVGRKMQREFVLSRAARDAVAAHSWPGNVRELVNAVHRAAFLAPGEEIEPCDLALTNGPAPATPESDAGPGRAIRRDRAVRSADEIRFDFEEGSFTSDDLERHLIVNALRHVRGNVSRAAKLIGMNRSSLRYRIERYGLEPVIQDMVSS